MPNLYYGISEITKAISKLEKLMISSNVEEAMDHWGGFVYHLNLSWTKTERGMVNIRNKFQPWQGYYVKRRKEDPLLSYLKNARDSHEHTITTLIDLSPVNYNHLMNQHTIIYETDEKGSVVEGSTQVIHYYQSGFKLREFNINNGLWVPPSRHNNHALRFIGNPFEVGYYGCIFYLNMLLKADQKFLKSSNSKTILALLNSKVLSKAKNYQIPNSFSSEMLPIKGGTKIHVEHREGVLLEYLSK